MDEPIVCKKCGEIINADNLKTQQIALKQGGYHLKACCPSCQSFIKFIPHSEPKLYFGKYKGELISEVVKKDAPYLRWLLSENLKPAKLKSDIREALCQIAR